MVQDTSLPNPRETSLIVMGSRIIPLKTIMANGTEDNDNLSIRGTVFEDCHLKCCILKERPKNKTSEEVLNDISVSEFLEHVDR